jgi:hypothetical protein
MTYHKYTDMAGNVRVIAYLSVTEALPLKFDADPTDKDIQARVDAYLADNTEIKITERELAETISREESLTSELTSVQTTKTELTSKLDELKAMK